MCSGTSGSSKDDEFQATGPAPPPPNRTNDTKIFSQPYQNTAPKSAVGLPGNFHDKFTRSTVPMDDFAATAPRVPPARQLNETKKVYPTKARLSQFLSPREIVHPGFDPLNNSSENITTITTTKLPTSLHGGTRSGQTQRKSGAQNPPYV